MKNFRQQSLARERALQLSLLEDEKRALSEAEALVKEAVWKLLLIFSLLLPISLLNTFATAVHFFSCFVYVWLLSACYVDWHSDNADGSLVVIKCFLFALSCNRDL